MVTTTTPPTGVVPKGTDHSTDATANGVPNPITGTTAGQVPTGTPPNTDTGATGGPPSATLQQHEPGTPNNAPPSGTSGVSLVLPISPGMQLRRLPFNLQPYCVCSVRGLHQHRSMGMFLALGTHIQHAKRCNQNPAESQRAANSCEHGLLCAVEVLISITSKASKLFRVHGCHTDLGNVNACWNANTWGITQIISSKAF